MLLERLLVEALALVAVPDAVVLAPTLTTVPVGASLIAVVGEVAILATRLLGAFGDEVVRITVVKAPGVLPPLSIVVDALKLVDQKTQVVVIQHLQVLICDRRQRRKRKARGRVSVSPRSIWACH